MIKSIKDLPFPSFRIEGAILSSLRLLMKIQEEIFDTVIIGDDLVSLATALQLAHLKPTWRIALLPIAANNSDSDEELSPFQSHNPAAALAIPLWRALEKQVNVSNGTFLNLTYGYLLLTDASSACLESCQQMNATQLESQFGFYNVSHGLFYSNGGYVNMTAVRQALMRLITKTSNIIVRQNEYFIDFDGSVPNSDDYVRLITNRGSLNASRLILVPGIYGNNVSEKFNVHLNMRLWKLQPVIYRTKTPPVRPLAYWTDGISLSGSSLLTPNGVQISPLPHSLPISSDMYPSELTDLADPLLITHIQKWVTNHFSSVVNVSDFHVSSKIRIAKSLLSGDGVIGHLPTCAHYSRKTFIYAGASTDGSASPFIPVWANMLTELVLETSSNSIYSNLFSSMSAENLSCMSLITERPTTSRSSIPSHTLNIFIFLFIIFPVHIIYLNI